MFFSTIPILPPSSAAQLLREIEAQWSDQDQLIRLRRFWIHHQLSGRCKHIHEDIEGSKTIYHIGYISLNRDMLLCAVRLPPPKL